MTVGEGGGGGKERTRTQIGAQRLRPSQPHQYETRPNSSLTPRTFINRDPTSTTGSPNTRRLALHDVGPLRPREFLGRRWFKKRLAVVEDLRKGNVLHRVLYPQVHVNGRKKKKKVEEVRVQQRRQIVTGHTRS